MHKTAHRSTQQPYLIGREFKDQFMTVHSVIDPLNELLNLDLMHESDHIKNTFINKVSTSLNPQTADLNEPEFIYFITPSFKIPTPANTYGVIDNGITEDEISLSICNDIRDFYSNVPTRAEYIENIIVSTTGNMKGIVYAQSKIDRVGSIFISTDILPCDTGSLYTLSPQTYEITDSSTLYSIDTYLSNLYKLNYEEYVTYSDTGSCTYQFPYTAIGDFRLFDILHLNAHNEPIEVSTDEYTLDSGLLTLLSFPTGRPSYNPDYYDEPSATINRNDIVVRDDNEYRKLIKDPNLVYPNDYVSGLGQPDQYWNGIYAATFRYSPIDTIATGLTTTGYLNNTMSNDVSYIVTNGPDIITMDLPAELAETEPTTGLLYRISPKYVRPGSPVTVSAEYLYYEEIEWSTPATDFTYTISHANFDRTNAEAIKAYINGEELAISVTLDGTNVTITALDSSFLSTIGTVPIYVKIYYYISFTEDIIAIASYEFDSINYADDYSIDETGKIIPFSIIPVDFDDIEDAENLTITFTTEYDLRGLVFDPYRKVFWSLENNNKYLTARSLGSLSIITNYSLFKNPLMGDMIINGIKHRIVDYSPMYDYDFASIKYIENYLMILTKTGILYILNSLDDFNNLDFRIDSDGNFLITPIALDGLVDPVDFTFDRDMNLLVIDQYQLVLYKLYKDYAFVDVNSNILYLREKYDEVVIDDEPGVR